MYDRDRDHIHSARPLLPVRTLAPTLELLSLDEAKRQCRVDFPDDNDLIAFLNSVVAEHLDGYAGTLGRALLTQTWRADYGRFPWDHRLRLPVQPATAISGITYFDTNNVQQTLSASVYNLLTDHVGPYASRFFNQVWPVTFYRDDAVSVTFTAGYASAGAVPKRIKQAALLMVADLYQNRETVNVGDRAAATAIPMPLNVEALLAPLRKNWV